MPISKSEEKRKRILEAGIRLFSENGYSKATIKDISKEAGVSFGTVFTYFETKDDLFAAAVLEPLEEVKAVMLQSPHPNEQPAQQIQGLIEEHIAFFVEKVEYARMIQYIIGQSERFRSLFEELDQFSLELRDALRPLILKGQQVGELIELNPNDVSDSYLAFINGARLTLTGFEIEQRRNMFQRQAFLLFGPKQ